MICAVELELEFALIMKNEYCPRIKCMFIPAVTPCQSRKTATYIKI